MNVQYYHNRRSRFGVVKPIYNLCDMVSAYMYIFVARIEVVGRLFAIFDSEHVFGGKNYKTPKTTLHSYTPLGVRDICIMYDVLSYSAFSANVFVL